LKAGVVGWALLPHIERLKAQRSKILIKNNPGRILFCIFMIWVRYKINGFVFFGFDLSGNPNWTPVHAVWRTGSPMLSARDNSRIFRRMRAGFIFSGELKRGG
jgi:hypothetical protein